MTIRLDGKVAVVTGAGGDIGSATVSLLLDRGACVLAADIGAKELERVRQRHGHRSELRTEMADVTHEAEVERMMAAAVSAFGVINILFNNAGIEGGPSTAWQLSHEVPLEDYDRVVAVNVSGVFLCMKHVFPAMRAAGGGSIINMSSSAGMRPSAGQMAYAASKVAVIGLTATAAIEGRDAGIRVNCVCPGPLEGRMMESIASDMVAVTGGEPVGLRGTIVPMGRWGKPSEVAALVAFLASDEAAGVTGAAYPIDGGFTA